MSGLAAGVNDTFRQAGIAVGVAALGALVPAGAAWTSTAVLRRRHTLWVGAAASPPPRRGIRGPRDDAVHGVAPAEPGSSRRAQPPERRAVKSFPRGRCGRFMLGGGAMRHGVPPRGSRSEHLVSPRDQPNPVPPDGVARPSDEVDWRAVLLARVETAVQEINAAKDALGTLQMDQPLVKRCADGSTACSTAPRTAARFLARDVRAAIPTAPNRRCARNGQVLEAGRRHAAGPPGVPRIHRGHPRARPAAGQRHLREGRDGLLYELKSRCGVSWDRFTILAEGELYHELAGVIRLRFPALDVWHLPVAAQLLGHMAAPALENDAGVKAVRDAAPDAAGADRRPGRRELRQLPARALRRRLRDIHDGRELRRRVSRCRARPRLRPRRRRAAPAASKRAHVILRTLARLTRRASSRGRSRKPRRGLAREALDGGASRRPASSPRLPREQRERLDALRGRALARILDETLDAEGRYRAQWWRRAENIADALARTDASAPQTADELIADVLNGVWLYRITPLTTTRRCARRLGGRASAARRSRAADTTTKEPRWTPRSSPRASTR